MNAKKNTFLGVGILALIAFFGYATSYGWYLVNWAYEIFGGYAHYVRFIQVIEILLGAVAIGSVALTAALTQKFRNPKVAPTIIFGSLFLTDVVALTNDSIFIISLVAIAAAIINIYFENMKKIALIATPIVCFSIEIVYLFSITSDKYYIVLCFMIYIFYYSALLLYAIKCDPFNCADNVSVSAVNSEITLKDLGNALAMGKITPEEYKAKREEIISKL